MSIGAPCNVPDVNVNCVNDSSQPYYGSIIRMNPDGTSIERVAHGIRFSVGFDWEPLTKELWFTDNGRKNMSYQGHEIPPDELNRVQKINDQHYGFPYCYGKNVIDPSFNKLNSCVNYMPAEQELEPHISPLGLRFYNPQNYSFPIKNTIIIAEHGSTLRSPPTGFKVGIVTYTNSTPSTFQYTPFITGWLINKTCSSNKDCDYGAKCQILSKTSNNYCGGWGTPTDIELLSNGSILISDDTFGAIWIVNYKKPSPTPTKHPLWVYLTLGSVVFVGFLIFMAIVLFITRKKDYEVVGG